MTRLPSSAFVPSPASRRFVSSTRRRDWLIALGAGSAILAFAFYSFIALSRQSTASGGLEGIITAKDFVPRQETQITVGREGVSSRQLAGEYSFQVRAGRDDARLYKVIVDPVVYNTRAVGDRYYFVPGRPPAVGVPSR